MNRRQLRVAALALADGRGSSTGIPRRKFGLTGETVSILGLGGAHLGLQRTEKESIDLIRRAVDAGIDFLDNCWDYHDGVSELRMGKALRNGYRDRVFLMTKIDGRDRKSATKQLDESLRRLRTDRLDLLQLHEVIHASDPQRAFAPGGAMEALVEARRQGKARFLGFTGHKSPSLHLAMLAAARAHSFRFDAVQLPLNVLDAHHDSFEKRVLPVLLEEGIAVLGMKPLGDNFVLQSGVASAPECLRYALSLPASVVITGIDSPAILEQALKVGRRFAPLSEEEIRALLAKSAAAAKGGGWEKYKTSRTFDGTTAHPEWLGGAAAR